jgi:hypothetical protein
MKSPLIAYKEEKDKSKRRKETALYFNEKYFRKPFEDEFLETSERLLARKLNFFLPGRIYTWVYDPISAKSLPYYDKMPLVLVHGQYVSGNKNKVVQGLNLNMFPEYTKVEILENYYKVFDQKSKVRKHMEETASNGQKKQAVAVNKNRLWLGGETLPKGTVCLLRISEGKNNIGVKDLPVVIIGVHYYRQSGNIRYKVASKDGFISGTFSRGELRPQEHVTAKLMGINVSQLEGGPKTALTPLQAHSMYLPIGGKNTKCRCKMDCSKSPSCSCRKAGKFCTKHCHKGNIVCQWCKQQP